MSRLDPLWQRAAVLGSLWAASEIVLGSFLHNARFPLAGHVLTGIAVALLVAGHRRWPEPGLLVRAGLIAALMKSLSPSAVLLGPMVAIAMEGLLMEVAVRVLRGSVGGYVLGGALAMSWTLAHRLVTLTLTYGPDLVRLYADMVALAERQVGPIPLGPWGPLAALALLNVAVGAGAAVLGVRLGARAAAAGSPRSGADGGGTPRPLSRPGFATGGGLRPSLPYLVLWAAALPTGLLWLAKMPLAWRMIPVAGALALGATRYRNVLRRLGRPGFWIALLVLTMLAGVVVSALGGRDGGGWLQGLAPGAGMGLNAVFVTLCFAALSVELAHPLLRKALERVGGGSLHLALQAAFSTLPEVVAALPGGRELLRNPSATLGGLLSRADEWLAALRASPRVLGVITAGRGEGKTTAASVVVDTLRREGLRVGGVLTPGEIRDGRRWSFDLVDLASGRRIPMATRDPLSTWPAMGSFRLNPEALAAGRAALSPAQSPSPDVLVVDEIGPWELGGDGWGPALDALHGSRTPLLLVVRRSLVSDVLRRFAPGSDPPVWDAAALSADVIARDALAALRG